MNIGYFVAKMLKRALPAAIKNSNIDSNAVVCSRSDIYNSKIGKYSYVGYNCKVVNTQIGNFCSIAENVIIGGASHPINWVSTSPVFNSNKNILNKNFSCNNYLPFAVTTIQNDVWIGAGAMIKAGVTINNGAIIGMGAIVLKDVGPYEIWGGNPAKLIKKRFDDETINRLIETEWWNFKDFDLKKYGDSFSDPIVFLQCIGNKCGE